MAAAQRQLVPGQGWQRPSLGVDTLVGRQVISMTPTPGWPGDRHSHHRTGHLVEALLDPAQAKVAQRGTESFGERAVAQEPEGE